MKTKAKENFDEWFDLHKDQYHLSSYHFYLHKFLNEKNPTFLYLFALIAFYIVEIYHFFIGKLTKYYPFSLLYTDRLFHYNQRRLRKFIYSLEKYLAKNGIDILLFNNRDMGDFVEFDLAFNQIPSEQELHKIEKLLQKKYGSVFIRGKGIDIHLEIPNELYENLINN